MNDDEGQYWAEMQAEAEMEALRVLSDCVIMLVNYLANDAQMDDVLVRQALHFADVFKTKATTPQE